MPKLFTLAEATALLPRLRVILTALQGEVAELEQVQAAVAAVQAKVRGNGHQLSQEPFARQQALREAINRRLGELTSLGIELKDPRTGLIDFPCLRDGQTVYLCWKLDEPEIGWWHPIETGFAGRERL